MALQNIQHILNRERLKKQMKKRRWVNSSQHQLRNLALHKSEKKKLLTNGKERDFLL